jgi:uncharacterized protein (DUF1778 family)
MGVRKPGKRKIKTEHLNIRVTEDQKNLLEKVAQQDGISLSSWVIQAALEKARKKNGNGH